MQGLHDGRDDPAGVGQDERQEQVGVDLIAETSHLSVREHSVNHWCAIQLEMKVKRRFAKVSIVSSSRQSLMIMMTQFHI